jgi:sugar (pentulose or hexulose) kinase
MEKKPVIVVFDIGKTNKKCLVFDADYEVVYSEFFDTPQVQDADGFPTEDLDALKSAMDGQLRTLLSDPGLDIRAVNFTTYGATIVNTDADGNLVHSLWDYLRPYDDAIMARFEQDHGDNGHVYAQTASPSLGNLNTGLQLYLLKRLDPALFGRIVQSTWLPQYLSGKYSGQLFSEATSVGCHTLCWDFTRSAFAGWTIAEGIEPLFPPMRAAAEPLEGVFEGHHLTMGIGMHDSSSALLPYLRSIDHPFMLLSTGSWSICLNPFNDAPLTPAELAADCLCYLTYTGQPVKASRLNAGFRHTEKVEALCGQHDKPKEFFWSLRWDAHSGSFSMKEGMGLSASDLAAANEYFEFLRDLVAEQLEKISIVASEFVRHIYVDGGFSKNAIFMGLLRQGLPGWTILAAEVGQSTALGAAMVLHEHWNPKPLRKDLVRFSG